MGDDHGNSHLTKEVESGNQAFFDFYNIMASAAILMITNGGEELFYLQLVSAWTTPISVAMHLRYHTITCKYFHAANQLITT